VTPERIEELRCVCETLRTPGWVGREWLTECLDEIESLREKVKIATQCLEFYQGQANGEQADSALAKMGEN